MWKVWVYSMLLLAGLVATSFVPDSFHGVVRVATMVCLAFIMVHVGYEFEVDKSRPGEYAKDAAIAFSAAAVPWLFSAAYLLLFVEPSLQIRQAATLALFAAPTSAGVLFAMLAAAGLGATWVFAKARVLAIFDDLGTLLLIIPIKMLILGLRWEIFVLALILAVLLIVAWRHLHQVRLPVSWPFVLLYAGLITGMCESLHYASAYLNLEVLLPAFSLGCVLARPAGADPHSDDATTGVEEGPESPVEQHVSTIVSTCFMLLVGLSMPAISHRHALPDQSQQTTEHAQTADAKPNAEQGRSSWTLIGLHALVATVLCNIGKLIPAFFYRDEASARERWALAIGMFPRGEVGAGVLVLSIGYGISGPAVTVAVLSLALNLLGTGLFIAATRALLVAPRSTP